MSQLAAVTRLTPPISIPHLSRIERGLKQPSVDVFLGLVQAYGFTLVAAPASGPQHPADAFVEGMTDGE